MRDGNATGCAGRVAGAFSAIVVLASCVGKCCAAEPSTGTILPKIRYTSAPPYAHGRRVDSVWERADVLAGFTVFLSASAPLNRALDPSEARVLFDDTRLYVDLRAHESSKEPVAREKGGNVFRSNNFEVFIKPDLEKDTYYQIAVSAAGDVYTARSRSTAWAPSLVRDMLMSEPLRQAEVVLYDIDGNAAQLVAEVTARVQEALGTKARVVATDNMAKAFRKADYFIVTIAAGGFTAMAHDIAIPEDYGIYHTVGDTSGSGGWARTLRNFDTFAGLGRAINRYAPGAVVLNYSNPMTTLTRILSSVCEGPVLGLCHGLFENLHFLQKVYGIENDSEISVRYAGLNHFFWITQIRTPSKDLMPDLRRRLASGGFTEMKRQAEADPMGFKSWRELATELWRLTGVMPYLGDRHTCEFFPGYITSKPNMRKYKLVRTSVAERREGMRQRKRMLKGFAAKGVPETFMQRSRETAADIIAAHHTGRPFIDVGNLPNIGQVAGLPSGTVVETAVCVDGNGFSPIAFGPLPPAIQGLVEPCARVFNLTVDACFACDGKLALQALRLDPVCSHLNNREVEEMGRRLIRAHRRFIPDLAV